MEKQQVVYIHGGSSYSVYSDFINYLLHAPIDIAKAAFTRWTETLDVALGEQYEVIAPTMPNKYNARYEEWKIWFERHLSVLHDGAILLGWSLGGIFLVKYLSENSLPFTVKAVFLLAAPYNTATDQKSDCGDFLFDPELVKRLTETYKKIFFMQSDDDFVVPFDDFGLYQKLLPTATFVPLTGKNHFLIPTFPELIAALKEATK